jgi:hypothetical protein
MWVMAMGTSFLYDALFNVGYRVAFPYLVMYNADKVLGHVDCVSSVHFLACDVQDFIWGVHFGWMVVWVLSPDRHRPQPKTCNC